MRSKLITLAILAAFAAVLLFLRQLDQADPTQTSNTIRSAATDSGEESRGEPTPAASADDEPRAAPAEPTLVSVHVAGLVKGGVDLVPVGGAQVRAYTFAQDGSRVEVSTTSDDQGLYALDLTVAAHWAGEGGKVPIGLDVEAQGRRALHELGVDLRIAPGPHELHYEVWLEPGGGFEGRVLGAGDRPAAGAEVYLFGAFDDAGAGWIEVDTTRALFDGRFLLRSTMAGSYSLRARADGLGATLRDLGRVAELGFTQIGDIHLSGGGVLSGRVEDPAGHGIEGVVVRAIHAELEPDWERARGQATRLSEGNLGQLYTETRSRPDGSFQLAGLTPGDFWILCEAAGSQVTEGFDPGPYATGTRDLRLKLAEYRLTVLLGARPGGGQPRGRAYCVEVVPARWSPGEGEGGAGGQAWEPLGEVAMQPVFDDNRAVFRVLPGRRYAVGIASSSLPPLEEIRVIGSDDFRPTVTLEPEGLQPFGRVRLWVDTPQGELLRTAEVAVVSPLSGVVLQQREVPVGSEGYVLELAPGRYRVLAGPRAWPQVGRPLLPGRADLNVRSNATIELELHTRSGGELELELDVEGEITEPELAAAYDGIRSTGYRPGGGVRERHGARVTLEPPDGGREQVVEFVFADGLQPFPPTALLPGERAQVAGVLQPGPYVLAIRAPGFDPLRLLIEVDVGSENHVKVDLVPR